MTGPERSKTVIRADEGNKKGSVISTLVRASSLDPGKSKKKGSDRSLKSNPGDRGPKSSLPPRYSGMQRAQSEMWDKKQRLKRAQKKRKKKSVLVKAAISPEDEALVQARRRRRKKMHDNGVTFTTVEIREHAITIGDNPGGFKGPPLSIEWKTQHQVKMPLDEYEENRPLRRTGAQMNIPFRVREEMLLDSGFARGEIREALRDVNIARRKRRRTIEVMNMSGLHEFTERLFRGSLNFTLKRGSKKKEREYLKTAWDVHRQMEDLDLDKTNDESQKEYLADDSSMHNENPEGLEVETIVVI
mmetsp:Transcript_16776/g.27855  ORF Transcript_16776/g.27855 Transcript_16776/m.27855 type:complete len:302 (+) Transcript_16776:141-1046(+)|eukprot:CAMPEP_0119011008 /NCGR_PEP_ID=MMETSP1176-20130426/5392_1 /TAXON_ID=265551 /ORGANISM="Synedropsis recta cf, Strain CCMP1620" /LENGTH=301 /DNA_ID=CAMNT_0006963763 /DNA_START=119 /DNA_END=1024 /DNA_ORIENTATION=-